MYDPYYMAINQITEQLKDLILKLESDNIMDKRIINLIRAVEELKKAKMKDSCIRR